MKHALHAALASAITRGLPLASLANTIKVGVIAPFSGRFAIYGKQYREAVETYVAQHGTTAGEHDIEFIYKDVGGPNPDPSRALAQELLIRDRVNYGRVHRYAQRPGRRPADRPERDADRDL